MLSTHANLDNQNELNQFLSLINPTLREEVTRHIVLQAISENDIFKDCPDVVGELITSIETLLVLPDDTVFAQGVNEKNMRLYFIAKGECQVGVRDHMYH